MTGVTGTLERSPNRYDQQNDNPTFPSLSLAHWMPFRHHCGLIYIYIYIYVVYADWVVVWVSVP